MAKASLIPKAEFSWITDYYFAEIGIIKVPIFSLFIIFYAFLGFILLTDLVLTVGPPAPWAKTPYSFLIYGLVPLSLTTLTVSGLARLKRQRLALLPEDELRWTSRTTKVIPWKDVTALQIRKKDKVIIVFSGRTVTLRARVESLDAIAGIAREHFGSAKPKETGIVVPSEGRSLAISILGLAVALFGLVLLAQFIQGSLTIADAFGGIGAFFIALLVLLMNRLRERKDE